MDYAYQTERALQELLKFEVSYSKTDKAYLFNDNWASSISESYYPQKSLEFKKLLFNQLKYGLKQEEYLQNLLDIIWKKVEYIEDFDCYSSTFFEVYSDKIRLNEDVDIVDSSSKKLFQLYKSGSLDVSSENYNLFVFLQFHSKKLNELKTIADFEKGYLLYVIGQYMTTLKDLHGFLYGIHMNSEFTDFKSINLDALEKFDIEKKQGQLGHFNLSKKEIAHLFRILLEEGFLVFDEMNEAKSKLKMKRFVEANFTYQNLKKQRSDIKTFNREYSEVCSNLSEDVKGHKDFIDRLISKLQARKATLKD